MLKKKTPKEIERNAKRKITKETRVISRDIKSLEKDEKKCVSDIKKAAQKGDEETVKNLAKNLLQIRNTIKMANKGTNALNGVANQVTQAAQAAKTVNAIKSATKQLKAVQAPVAKTTAVLLKYQKEAARMEMNQELTDDILGDMVSSSSILNRAYDSSSLIKTTKRLTI